MLHPMLGFQNKMDDIQSAMNKIEHNELRAKNKTQKVLNNYVKLIIVI